MARRKEDPLNLLKRAVVAVSITFALLLGFASLVHAGSLRANSASERQISELSGEPIRLGEGLVEVSKTEVGRVLGTPTINENGDLLFTLDTSKNGVPTLADLVDVMVPEDSYIELVRVSDRRAVSSRLTPSAALSLLKSDTMTVSVTGVSDPISGIVSEARTFRIFE